MSANPIDELRTGGKVLRVTRWSEPVLHTKTAEITVFDDSLRSLVKDMFATMEAAQGVGLAATQVDRGLALFIYDCPDEDDRRHIGAICNPVVDLPTGKDRHLDSTDEGCLSFPGAYEALARPDICICRGQDPWGNQVEVKGTGLLARCLQHETDHLNGIVFGDRLSSRSRRKLDAQQAERNHLYPDDWPITPKRSSADDDTDS